MKTIVQLLIVALLMNAAFQAARSYYTFFDYRSSLTEEAQKPRVTSASQLHQRAIDLGTDYGLDIPWEAIRITTQGDRTIVNFSYVDPVAFVPKYYVRPWAYEGSISTMRQRPLDMDER